MIGSPVTTAGVVVCALFSGGYFYNHLEGPRHSIEVFEDSVINMERRGVSLAKKGWSKAVAVEQKGVNLAKKGWSKAVAVEQKGVNVVKKGLSTIHAAEQRAVAKAYEAEQKLAKKVKQGGAKVARKLHDVEDAVFNRFRRNKVRHPHSFMELILQPDLNSDGKLDVSELKVLAMGNDECWGLFHVLVACVLCVLSFWMFSRGDAKGAEQPAH